MMSDGVICRPALTSRTVPPMFFACDMHRCAGRRLRAAGRCRVRKLAAVVRRIIGRGGMIRYPGSCWMIPQLRDTTDDSKAVATGTELQREGDRGAAGGLAPVYGCVTVPRRDFF